MDSASKVSTVNLYPIEWKARRPLEAVGPRPTKPAPRFFVWKRVVACEAHLRSENGASAGAVGVPGFEPGTPWSQTRCATGLRYTPNINPLKDCSLLKGREDIKTTVKSLSFYHIRKFFVPVIAVTPTSTTFALLSSNSPGNNFCVEISDALKNK